MDNYSELREDIMEHLRTKANLKQKVFDNTFTTFNNLKDLLHEMSSELNDDLEEQLDKRVKIEYRDRGKFEAQLQVASDLLLFYMHTDIFSFNREHPIWVNPYIKDNPQNSYCGVINIYNFLNDSLKYNRNNDDGYLIGRVFINHEMMYFVEGKRQRILRHDGFGRQEIDKEALTNIVETAINYSLNFDLLTPPYDLVKTITVDQLSNRIEHTKMETSKRLGYGFESDDI